MDPLAVFQLASEQSNWLHTRQEVVARNVANSNTPGYRARDIEPFSKILDRTALTMATTSDAHMSLRPDQTQSANPRNNKRNSWDTFYSGNSVNVEEELLKAGTISRQYSLNTAIVKKMHTLLLSSTKGPR